MELHFTDKEMLEHKDCKGYIILAVHEGRKSGVSVGNRLQRRTIQTNDMLLKELARCSIELLDSIIYEEKP